MKTKQIILTALAMAAIGGHAAVGPNYKKPQTVAPAAWSEPLLRGETNAPTRLADWWKSFGDPELDSLVDRAVRSNLDLRIAQARVQEARAQYRIASGQLWPSADASGSYSRVQSSRRLPVVGSLPIPPSVPFENNFYSAGVDVSWELDVFGGVRRSREAAAANVGVVELGERATLVMLLGDVAKNYIDVRGYQRQLAIAGDNIAAQEKGLAITRDRFAQGLTSDLDVQQATTLLASTRSEVPSLESSLKAAMHRIGVLVGQSPEAVLVELEKPAGIPATPRVVPVALPSELLRRRPDVQRAERQLAAATANIGVATADLFPKFSLTGAAGFQSVSVSDWFATGSKFWSLGPTVQWRIFDAGRIRANIKVQNARQEQALAAYEQTALTAFEEVENALVAYAKEQTRHASLEEAATASQKSLKTANQLYAGGLTDFLHVLDAERSLYQTQDRLVQSEKAVSADLVALYKALGGGWELERPEAVGARAGR